MGGPFDWIDRGAGSSVVYLLALAALTAFPTFAVSALVTGDAIREVRDAFADMLRADVGFGVLMAAIAGVLPPIARRMARRAILPDGRVQ
jgi:hypothetical protein